MRVSELLASFSAAALLAGCAASLKTEYVTDPKGNVLGHEIPRGALATTKYLDQGAMTASINKANEGMALAGAATGSGVTVTQPGIVGEVLGNIGAISVIQLNVAQAKEARAAGNFYNQAGAAAVISANAAATAASAAADGKLQPVTTHCTYQGNIIGGTAASTNGVNCGGGSVAGGSSGASTVADGNSTGNGGATGQATVSSGQGNTMAGAYAGQNNASGSANLNAGTNGQVGNTAVRPAAPAASAAAAKKTL